MLSFSLAFLSIPGLWSAALYREESCNRIRKPIHTLSEDERMLYVDGFQELRKNGKLEILSTTHAANVASHKGSSFFFLHAYMIWEAETAIRELGGKYECFSMPYWDYTEDAGLERDPTIFHMNVGANGVAKQDFCMEDTLWDVPNYWSTDAFTCMNDEVREPPTCCLKRSVSDSQLLPSAMQIASVFLKNSNFLMFETQIDHYHVWPHFYLAVNTWSQMATAYAMDDPLFFLLHTFTLYQRALWTTCYEYDKIDAAELQYYRDAYTPSCNPNMVDCGVVGLDAAYNLNPLNEAEWALASKMDITPRTLYNIQDWNVQYDLGTFYSKSKLNEWCEFNALHDEMQGPNPDWFVDLSEGYDELSDYEQQSNDLQQFIDETWNDLKTKQSDLAMSNQEIYFAVESLSCKYHRSKSENSCYDVSDDIMAKAQYETCASRNIFHQSDVTLDDMLQFDGVKDNECLSKRRRQLYPVASVYGDSIKLCNGEYDYKCPEWTHPALDQTELATNGKLKLVSSYNSNGYNYMILISIIVFAFIAVCFVMMNWVFGKRANYVNAETSKENAEYGTF